MIFYTSGFRPDYARWYAVDAFDGIQSADPENGASSTIPGLYFCGVHFLRKRKSSLLMGVGEDADVCSRIDRRTTGPGESSTNGHLHEQVVEILPQWVDKGPARRGSHTPCPSQTIVLDCDADDYFNPLPDPNSSSPLTGTSNSSWLSAGPESETPSRRVPAGDGRPANVLWQGLP